MSAWAAWGELEMEQLAPHVLGAKGAWLHWLVARGALVPAGFVVPADALPALVERAELDGATRRSLARLRGGEGAMAVPLAVRASPVESQPGLLPTRLDCRSDEDVGAALQAIHEAAASVQRPCAAVVQRQVCAGPSGFSAAVFSRDPSRGYPGLRGAWNPGGPAAPLVDGRHDLPDVAEGEGSLRRLRPADFEALQALAGGLEQAAGRILELEVVHDGAQPWLVQARPVARQPLAALRLASERVGEPALWLDLHPADAEGQWVERVATEVSPLAQGLAASPGVASGVAVTEPAEAERRAAAGEAVLLVRPHALPEDVAAVAASAGVLTSTGGLTCHAAVIARGLGKPAVVSCRSLEIGAEGLRLGGAPLASTATLTLDGHSGAVYRGEIARVRLPSGAPVKKLLKGLQSRRAAPLWVWGLPPSLWGEALGLGVDGVVVPHSGEPPAPLSGLPLWQLDPAEREAHCISAEHSGTSPVPIRTWNEENDAHEGVARWAQGPPPQGRTESWALPAAWIVPADHMLTWALTLDPVRANAHNGPMHVVARLG